MEYYQLKAKAELAERMFERGAQSRQAEIDSINRDLNHAFATVELQNAKIDELQKRIKKSEKLMRLFFKEDSYEYAISAHDELKGKQND